MMPASEMLESQLTFKNFNMKMFVLFSKVSSFNLFTLVVDILKIFEKAAHSVRAVSHTDRKRDGHTYGFRRRQTHSALVNIHLHTYV